MAKSIRLKKQCRLSHQANLGEEVAEVEFAEGDELVILKEWAHHYLAKSGDGKLFNVPKDLASAG